MCRTCGGHQRNAFVLFIFDRHLDLDGLPCLEYVNVVLMTGQKYPGSSHILRTPYMSYSDDTGGDSTRYSSYIHILYLWNKNSLNVNH